MNSIERLALSGMIKASGNKEILAWAKQRAARLAAEAQHDSMLSQLSPENLSFFELSHLRQKGIRHAPSELLVRMKQQGGQRRQSFGHPGLSGGHGSLSLPDTTRRHREANGQAIKQWLDGNYKW